MRLRLIVQWIGILGCFGGCSTLNFSDSGYYRSSLYDVKGNAPDSMALPSEEQLENIKEQSKADYHFTLAETYSMQGKWAKAVENYKMTLIYDPKSHVSHYRLAGEYVRGGLVNQAIEHCEKAIKMQEDYPEAHLLLASLHSVMGLHDEARIRYRQLLKQDPENHEAAILIGASYVDEGRLDEGIKYFEKLARKTKQANVVWYYLGRTYLQKNDDNSLKNAETAFKTSISLEPDFVQSVIELGGVYEKQGHTGKALKLYESYQDTYGPDMTIAESLAQMYLVEEMYDKALGQLQLIAESDPKNLNVQLKMAFIMVDQKQYDKAIPLLEGILHATPDSDRVRFYLGAVYEEIKNYSAAIQQFNEIQKTSKYYADSLMHTAYLYKLQGDMNKATSILEKNLSFVEDNPKVYALYGSLLDTQKEYKKARDILEAAVEKFPKDTQVRYQLGAIYDQLGEKDKTVMHMEELLEIDQDHIEGLNYLAFVYAERTENLETAEQLVKRALKLKPDDGYILDTLGWVLYKQNRLSEAVRTLEKAHQIENGESVIAEHLGDAYFKIQLHNKAKEMYIKAVENEKDSTKQRELRAKIDTIDQRIQTEMRLRSQRLPASK